jgi:hypothetical protein
VNSRVLSPRPQSTLHSSTSLPSLKALLRSIAPLVRAMPAAVRPVCLPPPPVTLKLSERPRFIHRPQYELTCSCVHLLSAQLAARSIAARSIAARSIARSNVGRAPTWVAPATSVALSVARCRRSARDAASLAMPPIALPPIALYTADRSLPPIALH